VIDGPVEGWLLEVEVMMRVSMRKLLNATLLGLKGAKREKWVSDFPGQLLITAGQMVWTPNPKPYAISSKPKTLKPEPSTLNQKP